MYNFSPVLPLIPAPAEAHSDLLNKSRTKFPLKLSHPQFFQLCKWRHCYLLLRPKTVRSILTSLVFHNSHPVHEQSSGFTVSDHSHYTSPHMNLQIGKFQSYECVFAVQPLKLVHMSGVRCQVGASLWQMVVFCALCCNDTRIEDSSTVSLFQTQDVWSKRKSSNNVAHTA